MPSYFTQIFSNVMAPPAVKRNLDFSYRHMPMLNEVSTSLSSYLASQGQISKKKALMRWYKQTPELVAFINKVVNDISSFYHFEDVGAGSGKNRILKANRFALNNSFRQLRSQLLADALISGDGFLWKGKIKADAVAEKIKEAMNSYSLLEMKGDVAQLSKEQKEKMATEIYSEMKQSLTPETDNVDDFSKFNDEDVIAPKVIRYVPSSTVEVVYDRYDIKGYNHFLGVYLPMFFNPDEIVHFTLMKRDGKVNGFTPVESVIVQLELLRQMWQNQLALHKNGGAPDKVFNLKNLSVSSPAYKRIEEQIQKYKIAENKHGNMLFTGDLEVIDLQQLEEMQFKDMGLYVTGLVAMQWGIPRSSIPFIVGGTNTKDDTGGNSERGYWQFIKGLQMVEAEIWNTQLWIPFFKVKLVPELSYPQLEVQEESARMSKIQNIQNMDMLLQKNKKMISFEKKMEILGLSEEDMEEVTDEMLMMQQGGMNTGTPKTTPDKPKSDQGEGRAVAKRQEQQNTIASRGKPSGYGKEIGVFQPHLAEIGDIKELIEGIKQELLEFKTFSPKIIQNAILQTQYENAVKLRKDEPVKQYSGMSVQDPLTDTAGAEMPANWEITKDNIVAEPHPEKNMISQPKIQPQLNTYPTGSITTENLFNPAGNIGYPSDAKYGGDNDYVDINEEDKPLLEPTKKKGKYPTQTKYPDEPTQFPGKDEKETQLQKGRAVEEEHKDIYTFIKKVLKETGKLPPWEDIRDKIAKAHIEEVSNYYTRLKKMEEESKGWDVASTLEFKTIQGKEVQELDIDKFVKIYNEDKRYHPGKPPRIFMRKSGDMFPTYTFTYKSNDFVYKSSLSETDIRTARADILLSNISGNVYRL